VTHFEIVVAIIEAEEGAPKKRGPYKKMLGTQSS
jgi:hypothetical protein